MVAIAEAISESKHGGRRQLRRTSVCSAVNPRFCSFSRLFVVRCSLTVDEGQDPAGYPGAAAHCRGVGTGFRGADAEHNCGEHRSLPLNPGAAAHCRGVGTGFRGADEERKCIEHRSPPLNINGANTYQFVMSNPVGNVDPTGLSLVTAPPPVAPPFVEPWIMPTGPQGPGWEPFNAPEFPPEPTPEPGLTPVAEGTGGFLDFLNPWLAVLAPIFDTPPAGGTGDTVPIPAGDASYFHAPTVGPHVQTSSDGGARRNPKSEDGNPGDMPTNPGGGGK